MWHLGTEYRGLLETDNPTPYYLNLHLNDVAHTLIPGATGPGKSYLSNFLLQNAQEYASTTIIFDIGGSFEALTHTFEGMEDLPAKVAGHRFWTVRK